MPCQLVVNREGSPIEIIFEVEEMAANALDNICEAPSLDAVKAKRTDGGLDGVIGNILAKHIQDAITKAHTMSPVKPVCTLRDL